LARETELIATSVEAVPTSRAVQASAGYETGAAHLTSAVPRVIAEFSSYAGLLAALRLVREQRNISFETLDEIVGAPKGYFSKVFAPNGERRITTQGMEWALAALGVRCLIVDDPDMLKQINGRMVARNQKVVRAGAVHIVLSRRFLSKIGRLGAAKRNAQRRARKEAARKAAMARWHGRINGKAADG
jgi:hypothetical protein